MKNTYYITTTLPYVNAAPHLGHAMEFVQADVLARAMRFRRKEVFFSTGSDEHGQKIYQNAQSEGKDPQEYTDYFAEKFEDLKAALGLSYDAFIRTTSPAHKAAASEMWRRCLSAGDIYKKKFKGHYCVGCELFLTDKDLVDGECPHHPGKKLEIVEEENYFFRLSKYEQPLLDYLESVPVVIVPESRRQEAIAFVSQGLQDFSVSRLAHKMPWGIPVPEDSQHVMYVWFDALTNYISTLGWPSDTEKFSSFWPGIQIAGKDQVRMQSIMWQGMLLSAGLPLTSCVFYHGFVTSEGKKMSKSIGNILDPYMFVKKYGTDAVRYYILRHIHPSDDSDVTISKFHESYTAHLVNGLGNLVSRIMTMACSYDVYYTILSAEDVRKDPEFKEFWDQLIHFEFQKAMDYLWEGVQRLDKFITEQEPFKKIKSDRDAAKSDVAYAVTELWNIAVLLEPFMPETSQKIQESITTKTKPQSLFERK